MRLGCEWRHARKRWAGNFGDFWKKQWVEICPWTRQVDFLRLGEASPVVVYGMHHAFVGSVSWDFDSGPRVQLRLTEERCRNSQHSKNCVSLSLCWKTKSPKKLINVSELSELSVFRDSYAYTFSSYVRLRDVVLKTCLGRWTIGRSRERGSGISVLPARYDDDAYVYLIYLYRCIMAMLHFFYTWCLIYNLNLM